VAAASEPPEEADGELLGATADVEGGVDGEGAPDPAPIAWVPRLGLEYVATAGANPAD
jgi:hypothetical protein